MIEWAKAEGLRIVEGQVLRENTAMLDMCRRLGFGIRNDPDDSTSRSSRCRSRRLRSPSGCERDALRGHPGLAHGATARSRDRCRELVVVALQPAHMLRQRRSMRGERLFLDGADRRGAAAAIRTASEAAVNPCRRAWPVRPRVEAGPDIVVGQQVTETDDRRFEFRIVKNVSYQRLTGKWIAPPAPDAASRCHSRELWLRGLARLKVVLFKTHGDSAAERIQAPGNPLSPLAESTGFH